MKFEYNLSLPALIAPLLLVAIVALFFHSRHVRKKAGLQALSVFGTVKWAMETIDQMKPGNRSAFNFRFFVLSSVPLKKGTKQSRVVVSKSGRDLPRILELESADGVDKRTGPEYVVFPPGVKAGTHLVWLYISIEPGQQYKTCWVCTSKEASSADLWFAGVIASTFNQKKEWTAIRSYNNYQPNLLEVEG